MNNKALTSLHALLLKSGKKKPLTWCPKQEVNSMACQLFAQSCKTSKLTAPTATLKPTEVSLRCKMLYNSRLSRSSYILQPCLQCTLLVLHTGITHLKQNHSLKRFQCSSYPKLDSFLCTLESPGWHKPKSKEKQSNP